MRNTGWSPCPVCESQSLHVAEWYDSDGGSSFYVVCDDCGYEDPDRFEEEHVAIDHWNRRVVKGYIDGDDPTASEYDMLEEDDWDRMNAPADTIGNISWRASGIRTIKAYHRRHRGHDDSADQ